MQSNNYDDPEIEKNWCTECRQRVSAYLERQGVDHGAVGERPAWHIAPCASIWAIQSLQSPGAVGWWAICGDLPTDYLSAADIQHPREALRAFAQQWIEVSSCMRQGIPHVHITIGSPDQMAILAPLIETRAALLAEWADDDSAWAEHGAIYH